MNTLRLPTKGSKYLATAVCFAVSFAFAIPAAQANNGIPGQVNELEVKVNTIAGDVATLQSGQTGISGEVSTLAADVSALTTEVSEFRSEQDGLHADLNAKLDLIGNKLDTLTQAVADADAKAEEGLGKATEALLGLDTLRNAPGAECPEGEFMIGVDTAGIICGPMLDPSAPPSPSKALDTYTVVNNTDQEVWGVYPEIRLQPGEWQQSTEYATFGGFTFHTFVYTLYQNSSKADPGALGQAVEKIIINGVMHSPLMYENFLQDLSDRNDGANYWVITIQ